MVLILIMAHVAILCSNNSVLGRTDYKTGNSFVEISYIVCALEQAGHRVDLMSPNGGEIPIDPNTIDFSDPIVRDYYERQTFLYRLKHSAPIKELFNKAYSAVVVCGGWGCVGEFINNKEVGDKIVQAETPNLVVIGYGAALLLHPAMVEKFKNYKITGPSKQEDEDIGFHSFWTLSLSEELRRVGYNFVFASPWSAHTIDSGVLLSAQNVFSVQMVGGQLIEKLCLKGE